MKPSDFLEILEAFPGRKELIECSQIVHYGVELSNRFDFFKLIKEIKEEQLKIDLPREENVWIKFIAFKKIVISWLGYESGSQQGFEEKEILSESSLKISQEIAKEFAKEFEGRYDSKPCIKYSSDMGYYALCHFVREGRRLFN